MSTRNIDVHVSGIRAEYQCPVDSEDLFDCFSRCREKYYSLRTLIDTRANGGWNESLRRWSVSEIRSQFFFPRHFLEIKVFFYSKGKRIFRQSCFVFMIHAKCHFDAWWIFPPQSARMILIECTYVRGYTRLKRLITDDLASRIYLRFGVDDTNRRITVVEFLLKFFLRYLSPYELKTLSNFSTNYKLSKLKLFLSLRFRIVKKFYCTTKMFL